MEVQSTFSPGRKIHGIGYGSLSGRFAVEVLSNEEYQRTVKAWRPLCYPAQQECTEGEM